MRSLAALALAAALLLTACGGALTGPPPRSTVVVVTAEGPYFTAFDSADDWLVGGSERSSGAVIDGAYRLAVEEPGIIVWTRQTRAFGDGVYEVDARLVSGPEASAFGLLLMGSSDLQSFVYAMITGDGRYDVGYCERACQTHESLVGGFTLSHAILVDYQPNHLRVEVRNGELTFSVNGTPVATVQGIQTGKGLVGFIGESGAYAGFEASFDNLQITPSGG